MAALRCFAFFGILQPDSTQTSATIFMRTKSHKLISQVGSARITTLQFSRETNYTNLLPHRSQIGSARIHRYSRIVQGTGYAYMEGN
jgi:hypothetical protein